jgi:hypothetical protein
VISILRFLEARVPTRFDSLLQREHRCLSIQAHIQIRSPRRPKSVLFEASGIRCWASGSLNDYADIGNGGFGQGGILGSATTRSVRWRTTTRQEFCSLAFSSDETASPPTIAAGPLSSGKDLAESTSEA